MPAKPDPASLPAPAPASEPRRFRVALSFPGTKRDFVREVAERLVRELGDGTVFYDNWFKPELARVNLDLELGRIYYEEAELLVPFFCQGYLKSDWCGLEWDNLRALRWKDERFRLMPFRFDLIPVPGLLQQDGYIEIVEDTPANRANRENRITPEQVAQDILHRLGHGPGSAPPSAATRGGVLLPDPLHSLPLVPPNFTGRVKELAALRTLDPAGGAVLTGLRGMGGIGKTALAIVLAHEWKGQFPDAQIFLDGQGLSALAPSATALMERVIHAFHPDVKLPDDETVLRSLYHQVLSGKKVLLVLDNAKDAKQAAPLIPPPGSGLIVTSRQTFTLDGRQPLKLGSLPEAEGMALLRRYTATLTDKEAAEINARCGGLPLALKLTGAWLAMDAADHDGPANAPRCLAKLKENRLALINKGADEADEELLTVSQSLRLSENPLTPEERDAWRALSVFPAPFDERAAQAVAGADEEMIQVLVRRCLVDWEKDRLKVHDLAAEYARSELGGAAVEALWWKYVSYYTALVHAADDAFDAGGDGVLEGLRMFDAERAHAEAAFTWLNGRTDAASGKALAALVNASTYTSELRFHPRQRIQWLEALLRGARTTGNRTVEGMALNNLGLAHRDLGDARRAIEYCEQDLAICRETGDRRGEGMTLNNLGGAHRDLGDVRQAIEYYELSLVIFRKTGDRRGEGTTLRGLGNTHFVIGDAPRAIEYYEQDLAICRETGDRRGEGLTLMGLGNAHLHLGDARRAMEYYEQSLVLYRETGDRRSEGQTLWNSALVMNAQGDPREAIARAEEALRIFEEIEAPAAAKVRTWLAKWKAAEDGAAE